MVIFHSYVNLPEGIPWISQDISARRSSPQAATVLAALVAAQQAQAQPAGAGAPSPWPEQHMESFPWIGFDR